MNRDCLSQFHIHDTKPASVQALTWPPLLSPQHLNPPVDSLTHAKPFPAVILSTVTSTPKLKGTDGGSNAYGFQPYPS